MVYNYTMNKTHVTTKIWKGSLEKMKIAAAISGVTQVEFVDNLIDSWFYGKGIQVDELINAKRADSDESVS